MFDAVLADVPCSGEGTTRRFKAGHLSPSDKRTQLLQNIQSLILDRAVRQCRAGGRIAYATCTFNPAENEAVINAALERWGGAIRIIPAAIEGLRTAPGLTSYENLTFHPSLAGAMRIWPHHNDTGGFFVCILEKGPDAARHVHKTAPPELSLTATDPSVSPWLKPLIDRFGLPKDFGAPYDWILHPNNQVFFHQAGLPITQALPPLQTGIPLRGKSTSTRKPKTAVALLMAPQAKQHVIDVDRRQADLFLQRITFDVTAEQMKHCTTPGFVLLRHEGYGIGPGLLRMEDGAGKIESQMPRQWVHHPEPATPTGSGS